MSRFDFIPERTLFSPQNKRLIRYLVVGAFGVAINQAVFLLVFNNTGIPYFIAGFLGSSVSTFTNYAINDSWTWKDRGAAGVIQWFWRGIKYGATRIVGMGIGTVAQIVFVEVLLINPAIANILKIGVGVLWGFGASEKWVWRSNKTPQNRPTTSASGDD
jgi:putative flippase GtrA